MIHHLDRGGQYASRRYRDVLRRSGMRQSMSAAASCYDNAFMESCFGTLKTELELVEYANGAEANHKAAVQQLGAAGNVPNRSQHSRSSEVENRLFGVGEKGSFRESSTGCESAQRIRHPNRNLAEINPIPTRPDDSGGRHSGG